MKEIIVSQENLIVAMNKAIHEKSEFLSSLMDLYLEMETLTEEGNIIIKNKKLANYILKKNGLKNTDELVTLSNLSFALSRAIYEYNYEMKNILQKYYRMLMDAKIKGEDITIITNIILDDKKVIDYIKKYDNLDVYIKNKKKTKIMS